MSTYMHCRYIYLAIPCYQGIRDFGRINLNFSVIDQLLEINAKLHETKS